MTKKSRQISHIKFYALCSVLWNPPEVLRKERPTWLPPRTEFSWPSSALAAPLSKVTSRLAKSFQTREKTEGSSWCSVTGDLI